MNFTLIVCTYMRPKALLNLLHSVTRQSLYPNQILVVDGSLNTETETALAENPFRNLDYFRVTQENRGLTKQRNFGISKVAETSAVVCFLDDDTVLEPDYFEEIIKTFKTEDSITGVGGVAINENNWIKKEPNKHYNKNRFYEFEGYIYPEGDRNILRNILGLASDLGPGRMPDFSHGRTCGFPLNDKTYEVDLLIGMSFAFRKRVLDQIAFSHYFEGYGLYEDADFSIRAQAFGKNVINTKAQLSHFHDQAGRPNKYLYGKMVVRNGWYVWRVKYPNPGIKARFKWNVTVLLLAFVRFGNIFTTSKRTEAFTEFSGRCVGWLSLFFDKPKTT
ncbi:glycosyltransferase family 2 protein [Flavobacterium silvisoli]|uniref:Glycosyltransferase family 2 protein n=1 Tax=Flavobacterium silvisoli TaxID=2529433 RepID=A0A4Q9YZ62_9FLAO|nr:glycosyltransferase family 2 protein [Flavobacterium silvisoli]TBX69243.1 glycosyltransferase family 2 protein [Flavobacterium silvisoli]